MRSRLRPVGAIAAVAEVSPETLVFPVFQLERLSGLQGGLVGGANGTAAARGA